MGVPQGFQGSWGLLQTSAVFLMFVPLAAACAHIYKFLSTQKPVSDGQKGDLLLHLSQATLAVVFMQSVQRRADISI